jgi:hypothetical protein
VHQFFILADKVLALNLPPADRAALRKLLFPVLCDLAEAPRPVTPASLDQVLRTLDRTPLVTTSGAFDAALAHLDALQEACTRLSSGRPPGSALDESARQRRRLGLVDEAVRRFNAAAEAGGPRQVLAPTPTPTPTPAPGPLGGWGSWLLLLAVVGLGVYVGCAPPSGVPGKSR